MLPWLQGKSPGLTTVDEVNRLPPPNDPQFKRIFVVHTAQVMRLLDGCRPVIGLDTCFLKGVYSGQLMLTVGRDGNYQIYPIAMTVVESECGDS